MDVNQISKIDIFSKHLLYKLLGGRPATETTGIILCVLMANILEPIKILKILKVYLRTYYIAGHLKQRRGPRVGQPCRKQCDAMLLAFICETSVQE